MMDPNEFHNKPQEQPAPYHSDPNERETDTGRNTTPEPQTGKKKKQASSPDRNTDQKRWPTEEPRTGGGNLQPTSEGYNQDALADIYYQKRRSDTPNYLASVSAPKAPLPSEERQAYEQLVSITRSNSPAKERIAAIRALANYGQFITPNILMLAMIDQDKFVRAAVLETCADLAIRVPVKLVESALADSTWTVRATAVWALSHFGDKAPRKRIATIADDKDESVLVRFWALYALGKLGDRGSTNRFLVILNNSKTDEHLREAAATALGLLGSIENPLTLQILHHTLGNEAEDALVRIAAAHSLARLSDPPEEETLLALTKALHNKDQDIREAADDALDVIAQQVIASIDKRYNQHPQPNSAPIRQESISALMRLRDRISEDALVGLLSHPDRAVRKAALDILTAPDEALPATNDTVAYLYNRFTRHLQDERIKARGLHKMGDGSFIPLSPDDLKDASISQALNGRWIPRSLLRLIMDKLDKRITAFDIRAYLVKQVRTEYIRSLLHSRSVAIAHTLLYSSSALFQDFLEGSPQREAFKWLINTGAIVPVLYEANTPDASPDVVRSVVGFEAWQHICQEVCMACIRFSTVEAKSLKVFRDLLSKLMLDNAHFIATQAQAPDKTEPGNTPEKLTLRLRKLATFVKDAGQGYSSLESLYEALYKEFVIVEDSLSRERLYDETKDAANEIKQIIDLAHDASLADALQCHLLTPGDTLPRSALQEWRKPAPATTVKATLPDMMNMVERCDFGAIRSDWYLKSLRFLSLQDVVEIRASRQWNVYMRDVESLMTIMSLGERGPAHLQSSLEDTYRAYTDLLAEINSMLEHRHTDNSQRTFWAKWTPLAELQINVGGAILIIRWTQDGRLYSYGGHTMPNTDQQPAFSMCFSIGEHQHTTASTDLSISFDLLHGRLDTSKVGARQQWENLKNWLSTQPPSQLPYNNRVQTGPTLS